MKYNKMKQKLSYKICHGNPTGGKEFQEQAKEPEIHPLSLLGVPQRHQAIIHKIYAEDLL